MAPPAPTIEKARSAGGESVVSSPRPSSVGDGGEDGSSPAGDIIQRLVSAGRSSVENIDFECINADYNSLVM